ncbi:MULTISPECIES: zeta toxin family protein [unclassified Synechocystis]|nr:MULTISPECIES: zeta toxin family protein [unclassified Synechocystis]
MSEPASPEKKVIIIAGPNGAGKTTFAEEFLPQEAQCLTFINADLIAAGLAPFEPEQAAFRAGRLMLEEIYNHAQRGQNFAFETTLSGRSYARLIPTWQAQSYIVKLFFLQLLSPELAIARVAQRVRAGGHHVPEAIIRRRFAAGLHNLETLYKLIVDEWVCYDNSGNEPVLINKGGKL